MSLIPFILDLADELQEINRCLFTGNVGENDDFAFGIYPHELSQQQRLLQRHPRSLSHLLWCHNNNKQQRSHPYQRSSSSIYKAACCQSNSNPSDAINEKTAAATASKFTCNNNSKNGFQVSMNVKQFTPNELSVRTIDNYIIVEGRHEEKEDGHGVISRHFIRKYMLPKGYEPKEVLSTLSSDGILTVKAPQPPDANTDEQQIVERIVDIQQTGPAHLSAKEPPPLSKEKTMAAATAEEAISQQNQQQQQQKQHQENENIQQQLSLQKNSERNGDYNSNEIEMTETDAAEKMPIPIVVNVVATPPTEDNNGIAAIILPLSIPNETLMPIPIDIPIKSIDVVDTETTAAVAAVLLNADEASAENLILQQPTAGDLVAAADAAILLAKYENGSSKAATEAIAN